MKAVVVALALFALRTAAAPEANPTVPLALPPDIKRLTLMVTLLDYPIEQTKMHGLLGLPESVRPALSSTGPIDDARGMPWFWPLDQLPDSVANSRLKVFYSNDTKQTTGRYPLINFIEVVYRSPVLGNYVADPNEFPLSMAPRLKVMLKRSGLSVLEFTAPGNLHRYYDAVLAEINVERKATAAREKANMPNTPSPLSP